MIFSATMVENGRPAPDLFLKAAAATAAGLYGTLNAAAMAMQQGGTSRRPNPKVRAQFDRDYRVFLAMLEQRQAVDALSRD